MERRRSQIRFEQSPTGRHLRLGYAGKDQWQYFGRLDSPGNFTLSMNIIVPIDGTDTNLADTTLATVPFTGTTLYLRAGLDFVEDLGTLLYSADGKNWTQLGSQFNLAYDWATGTFQGEQFALFCYNPQPGSGYLDVDWFRMTPPAVISNIVRNSDSSLTVYYANKPNSSNIIQASVNLANWENILTNKVNGNGLGQFTYTNASQWPAQFYRSYSP